MRLPFDFRLGRSSGRSCDAIFCLFAFLTTRNFTFLALLLCEASWESKFPLVHRTKREPNRNFNAITFECVFVFSILANTLNRMCQRLYFFRTPSTKYIKNPKFVFKTFLMVSKFLFLATPKTCSRFRTLRNRNATFV